MSQSTAPILVTRQNNIATWTINRPDRRNALNEEAIAALIQAIAAAETDDATRVVVLTGAGERAFCAGADLGGSVGGAGTAGYGELLKALAAFPKPLIARVNGYCLAGGMGLMLACDLVIAREDAQFGTPEVNVGLWPMMIGALIYRNMLRKHAAEMVFLGHRFDAAEAYRMGFVSHVAAASELDATVADLAGQLAAKSPIGLKIGKAAFYAMADMPFEQAVDYLKERLADVAATADAAEGVLAFMEKRPPNFQGR